MKKEHYDIFISYRREGGSETAKLLQESLKKMGYRVFLDIESLRSGAFNEQLYQVIEEVEDVLVVLPENALDRCSDQKDWLRLEIEHAHANGKNIVPIMLRGFVFPEELPDSIDFIRFQNGPSQAPMEYYDNFVDRIAKNYLKSKPYSRKKIIGAAAASVLLVLAAVFFMLNGRFSKIKGGTLSADAFKEWASDDKLNQIITEVSILDTTKDAPAGAKDLSEALDESVLGWRKGSVLYLAGNKGIAAPQDCSFLFSEKGVEKNEELSWSKLVKITGAENLNTANTKNMYAMFCYCSKMESIDVSEWDTALVENMGWMFGGCKSLHELDVSKWKTQNVIWMNSIFCDCSSLELIDVSNWDISSVKDMAAMFKNCTNLTNLGEKNISEWDTSAAETIHSLFFNCPNLQTLDVSDWDTSSLKNMCQAFRDCTSLTSLGDKNVSEWNTGSVKTMFSAFYNCPKLHSIDVSRWDTSAADNMGWMFGGCKALASLDVSGFKTQNVTNMSGMFSECNNLKTLEVSSWNTAKVGELPEDKANDETYKGGMNYMFKNCSSLTSLGEKGVGDWTVSEKTGTYKMFAGTRWENNPPIHSPGTLSKQKLTEWASAETTRRNSIEKIVFLNSIQEAPEDAMDFSEEQDRGVLAWLEGKTLYIAGAKRIFAPKDCSYLFSDKEAKNDNYAKWSALTSIENADILITADVENMEGMLYSCINLKTIDVSRWETSNVKNMYMMFASCESLEEVDVSGFHTANVTTMAGMFLGCKKLISFGKKGLSDWDTGAVNNMYALFYNCEALKNVDVSNWNTGKVKDMGLMFRFCKSLEELDVSRWDTQSVNKLNLTFADCSSLKRIDVSKWKTDNATTTYGLFYKCSSLSSLGEDGVGAWNTGKITDMSFMFRDCGNLTSLGENSVSGWKTGAVTNMAEMFLNCRKLQTIDVSGWDTSGVDNMGWMFKGCKSLTSLDVSRFDTGKVINMASMFEGCEKLESLDVSGWNTENVGLIPEDKADNNEYKGSMVNMFKDCSSLTSLGETGVSSWKISDKASTSGMFTGTIWEDNPPI